MREQNEDSYLILAAPALAPGMEALLAVADGVGGRQAGGAASNEVVEILNELFSSPLYQERVGYSLDREDYYIVALKEVLEQINEHLYNLASSQPALLGMGTTASVALLADRHLYVGHVGDSRIYHLRDGCLQQLTHDDSWVAEQVLAGALTQQQAAVHPQRNVITSCLGNSLVLRVERAVFSVQSGDGILLCSDGLSNYVGEDEIAQALATQPTPQAACDYLVQLANDYGGSDNITVVVVELTDEAGNNLLGGRALGPRQLEAPVPQTDTVKLMRPVPVQSAAACTRQVRTSKAARGWIQSVLTVLTLGITCVATALFGVKFLGVLGAAAPPWVEFVTVLLATALGFLAGYLVRLFLGESKPERPISEEDRREKVNTRV